MLQKTDDLHNYFYSMDLWCMAVKPSCPQSYYPRLIFLQLYSDIRKDANKNLHSHLLELHTMHMD